MREFTWKWMLNARVDYQRSARIVFCLLWLAFAARAQVSIPANSYVIQMNANIATADKGLRPYGMIHELVKFYKVPVLWVVREGKAKDEVDYLINGISYSGSLFVISSEYLTSEVQTAINQWIANANTTNGGNGYTRGFVVANKIPASFTFTGARTMVIQAAPLWTLDDKNGSIAEKFLKNAGIPSSAYNWLAPENLGACNDVFVMPHADPTWALHGNLLRWNSVNKGAIWAGCHAVSALENTYNPANTAEQMNFLTNKVTAAGTGIILPVPNKTDYSQNSLILWDKHKDGSVPYLTNSTIASPQTGKYTPADDWVSQYLGNSDEAHRNGSEQIYLPVAGGSWIGGANVITFDPTQEDVPTKSPGAAALIVYGHAFGDPSKGSVMYEAGHDINDNNASGVAAMRAFFNWSFLATDGKSPDASPISSGVSPNGYISAPISLSVNATSPIGASLTYTWTALRKSDSQPVGSFSANNSVSASSTVFTPPSTPAPFEIVIQVTVTDECGRRAVSSYQFIVTSQVSISGSVWHDPNGNGIHEVAEKPVSGDSGNNNGNSSSVTSGSLYANLVDANNNVVQSVRIEPNGNYIFSGVSVGEEYRIILTNDAHPPGTQLSGQQASLPEGWLATGTNFNSSPDIANRTNVLSLGLVSGALVNADFGIEQKPTVKDSVSEPILNPGGTTHVPVAATLFEGMDAEDAPGGYLNNLAGKIVTLYPGTGGTLYYNGNPVSALTTISGFDPTKVNIDPAGTSPWEAVDVTFKYAVTDNANILSDPATIKIPFAALLVCVDDINQTPEGIPVGGDVLTNDDGGALIVTGATQDAATITVGVSTTVSGVNRNGLPVSNAGAIVLNSDGTYIFTPASGFTGTIDPISYKVVDGSGNTSAAVLDIKVIPVITSGNDNPNAQDDNMRTEAGVTINANLLSNDSDPDGDPLTVTGASIPLGFTVQVSGVDRDGNPVANAGTLRINGDGSYTYIPADGFIGKVNAVNYTISDGKGGTDSAELNITVVADNGNTILASDDANSAPKGKTMTGNIQTNDRDPEGNPMTVTSAEALGTNIIIGSSGTAIPGVGTLKISPDGNYVFTPEPNFVGTVPVEYQICDAGTPSACDKATLYLTSLDMVVPDLTPIVTIEPNQIVGTSQFTARIRVLNLNSTSGGPTTGEIITVRILKNPKWTVAWNQTASSNSLGTLNNSIWTYSDAGIYHVWTTNQVLLKGSSRYIGFSGTFTSGDTMGATPVTVQIRYPSGGEVNDNNNTDVETINYSGL